jgi:hypothetical protein
VAFLRYRCDHVSYVERSNVEGEEEYLFAPYSPFTVTKVPLPSSPPHARTLGFISLASHALTD